MQDLYATRYEIEQQLMEELTTCRNSGIQYAENEAEYRKALRIEILKERMDGTPVTIIGDICRGKEAIANLKMARDASEAVYKSSQEAINALKLRLRMVEADIQRDWGTRG